MTTPRADVPETSLLRDYPVSGNTYDELLAGSDDIRPHWKKLIESFDRLGAAELGVRRDAAARVLRENGVTYNIYGD